MKVFFFNFYHAICSYHSGFDRKFVVPVLSLVQFLACSKRFKFLVLVPSAVLENLYEPNMNSVFFMLVRLPFHKSTSM